MLIGTLSAWALFEVDEKVVEARVSGTNLFLTHNTDSRVHYFVVGRETAAHINWAPHLNLDSSIAQNAAQGINHENGFRAQHEKEVIVHWWHAVWREGQFQPGEIHSFGRSLQKLNFAPWSNQSISAETFRISSLFPQWRRPLFSRICDSTINIHLP